MMYEMIIVELPCFFFPAPGDNVQRANVASRSKVFITTEEERTLEKTGGKHESKGKLLICND